MRPLNAQNVNAYFGMDARTGHAFDYELTTDFILGDHIEAIPQAVDSKRFDDGVDAAEAIRMNPSSADSRCRTNPPQDLHTIL